MAVNLEQELKEANKRYFQICEQHAREGERALELLELIRDDLKMRSDEDGVINMSNFIWQKLEEAIDEHYQPQRQLTLNHEEIEDDNENNS